MTTLAQPPVQPETLTSSPPPGLEPDANAAIPFEPRRSVRARTLDEIVGLVGSAFGSLALTWVLYERVLAWSGWLGFLLCWYAAFLGIFALVTSIGNPRPIVIERLVSAVVHAGAALVGFALLTTVVFIMVNGLPALLHRNFYTHDMAGVGPNAPLDEGGIFHALVGTAIQVGIATMIALPLGVGTAVYMTEVGGKLARTVRTVVEAMTALPDILAGLFVYTVLIIGLGWPRNGFAAAMALTVTMLPIIARSAEVVLRVVPGGLREAGLALGASQYNVVRRVVLPTARAGLATALILGIARIAGETAPLLIVSGASTYTNFNPFVDPMNSLPLFIFSTVRSGQDLAIQRGYGAAALLLFIVVILFVITRFLARDKVRR
jgi:phosphate transport system permease protein